MLDFDRVVVRREAVEPHLAERDAPARGTVVVAAIDIDESDSVSAFAVVLRRWARSGASIEAMGHSAWIALIALLLSGCTLVGGVVGGGHAQSQNGDPRVERGEKPRTSVAKSFGIGAGIGLVIDLVIVIVAVDRGPPGH